MCLGGGSPSVPAAPPAPPPVAKPQDEAVLARQETERLRRAQAMGRAATMITGGQGIAAPVVSAGKSLLGQ